MHIPGLVGFHVDPLGQLGMLRNLTGFHRLLPQSVNHHPVDRRGMPGQQLFDLLRFDVDDQHAEVLVLFNNFAREAKHSHIPLEAGDFMLTGPGEVVLVKRLRPLLFGQIA
ncbi:hypothetical protein D3C81_1315040 [compost metagenome]